MWRGIPSPAFQKSHKGKNFWFVVYPYSFLIPPKKAPIPPPGGVLLPVLFFYRVSFVRFRCQSVVNAPQPMRNETAINFPPVSTVLLGSQAPQIAKAAGSTFSRGLWVFFGFSVEFGRVPAHCLPLVCPFRKFSFFDFHAKSPPAIQSPAAVPRGQGRGALIGLRCSSFFMCAFCRIFRILQGLSHLRQIDS